MIIKATYLFRQELQQLNSLYSEKCNVVSWLVTGMLKITEHEWFGYSCGCMQTIALI